MVGIGVDLERIDRFAKFREEGWAAFLRSVYTPGERVRFGMNPLRLALCFTAKEAVSKALGTGLHLSHPDAVRCTDIEIECPKITDEPRVALKGKALEVADRLKLSEIILCWRHNDSLAYSIAIGADNTDDIPRLRAGLDGSAITFGKLTSWTKNEI
jgi:holo-[acyl-carrier protein] synthase